MLSTKNAVATIAVRDIEAARRFYEDTLGLTPDPSAEEGVLSYRAGGSSILVYTSQFAGTNQATAATWYVEKDLDSAIADLKSRGVRFEHYDMPGVTRKGDVHLTGSSRAAWFKDPDGNIHALVGA
jgi:catechol-2,3-dioxygenase